MAWSTWLVVWSLLSGSTLAFADAPLRPPHRYTVCSSSQRSCVTSDPQQGTFAHPPAHADLASARWKIPQWFRVLFVSDNPDDLVTGYDGQSLVPLESPGSIEIVSFWRRGALVRSYTLSALVPDHHTLPRTASHYRWGTYDGFDADGTFRLTTADGTTFVFDPAAAVLLRRGRRAQ